MSRPFAFGEEDNTAIMSLSQECYAIPENEGDLTDEYIINMICSAYNPLSFDYQPLKLYDQLQDVVNMPSIDATHDHGEPLVTEGHIVPYHGEVSPMPCNSSDASPHLGSPSFIPVSSGSPAGMLTEPKLMNNSEAMLISPQGTLELNYSPSAGAYSPSAGAYPESSVGTLEESRYENMALTVPENSEASENALSVAPFISSTVPMAAETSVEVSADTSAPPKKKRGRKPKSLAEKANSPSASLRKIKRVKAYEISRPFVDKEKERKRLNAVNAKKHRELQKELKKNMEKQLADVTIERDIFKRKKEEEQKKTSLLTRQLEAVKRHFGIPPFMNPFPEEDPQPQN